MRVTRRTMIVLGVLALVAGAFLAGVGVGRTVPNPDTVEKGDALPGRPPSGGTAGPGSSGSSGSPGGSSGSSGMPAVQAEGTRLSVLDAGGGLVWELEASTVEGRDDNQSVYLKQVKARHYKNGRVAATVSAPEATLFGGTGEVRFAGGVAARVPGGPGEAPGAAGVPGTSGAPGAQEPRETRLEAMTLAWDPQKQVLIAEGQVRMEQGQRFMTGDKLTGDGNLQRVRMEGHVKVRSYQPPAGGAASPGGAASGAGEGEH
ncbi:MAG: LPS export ABC transporter periplasmic protein LptC [Firmicutes bacterium]|nr:LPS export ABC transporter periplasmic protein LptC [Bacillota bacterium]